MRKMVLVAALACALGAPAVAAAGEPVSADRHAVWRDPDDPERTLIVAAGASGLSLYDLSGARLQAVAAQGPSGLDLRERFPTSQGERVLVAVSETGRSGAGVALYFLDPARRTLEFWAAVPLDLARPQGVCLARRDAAFLMIVSGGDGEVRQLRVEAGADGTARVVEERRFAIDGSPAGCVADDAHGRLYLTEAGRGVRGFDLAAAPAGPGEMVADAPSPTLLPDVDSLSLLEDGGATWLVASSRVDSAIVVWRLDETLTYWFGSYDVVDRPGVDGMSGARGVAARGQLVGGFAGGLVVTQAGQDGERSLKLVDWGRVRDGLGL